MKRDTSLSLVIPCFNEGKTIQQNLLQIHAFLEEHFSLFEIIAVDDGSTDNTRMEIEKARHGAPSIILLHNQSNEGKGSAVRKGILTSRYDLVAFLDADLGIPVETLLTFIPEVLHGHDIVIGSRFVPGLTVKKKVLWYRRFMERVFRLLRILILQEYAIQDTQCGCKLFTRNAAQTIFSKTRINRFAFDAEVLSIALKHRFSIRELPIILQNPTESSVRLLRDPLNMTMDLLRIRVNTLRGRYNANPKKNESADPKIN